MMQPFPVLRCVVLLGLCSTATVDPLLQHSVALGPDVVLHWTPEDELNSATFRLEARTRGWAAIGFSPTGGMAGADIVMAWVTDGRPHIQDMHALENGAPLPDDTDNVQLLSGHENDTHTVFTFRRPLRSCDLKHDLDLGADTTRLIWALHPSDPPPGGAPSYHGSRRGVRSVSLDGSGTFRFPTKTESESFVIRNTDTEVLKEHTHYHCEIHKMPDFGQKVHYTGYRVRLDPTTARYVHHMDLISCSLPPEVHGFFEEYVKRHPGARCYSPNMPPSWTLCKSLMVAWSIGSEGDMLPDDVGMPLGNEHDESTFFMLETHYDNPQIHEGLIDSSGLELFFTRSLRPVEAGLLTVGHMVTATQLVPPRQALFTTGAVCPQQCTRKHLPSEGVRVHSVTLHGHLAARAIRLRHVRARRELTPIIVDQHYDFNYQQSRGVDPSLRIMPGDNLIVECDYNTMDRTNITMGGYSTSDEMCLAFITYFPRSALTTCASRPHLGDFLESMDVPSVDVEGLTLPSVSGVDFWVTKGFKQQELSHTGILDGSKEERNETREAEDFTRDSRLGVKELSSLVVSAQGDTPSVTLYEYLMTLDWERPAVVSRLRKMSRGGRLFHRCETDGHHKLRDYRNTYSGPQPYPEFEPLVPAGKPAYLEAGPSSAGVRSRPGGATSAAALLVLVLRLVV